VNFSDLPDMLWLAVEPTPPLPGGTDIETELCGKASAWPTSSSFVNGP
jgi:hypothetical protein